MNGGELRSSDVDFKRTDAVDRLPAAEPQLSALAEAQGPRAPSALVPIAISVGIGAVVFGLAFVISGSGGVGAAVIAGLAAGGAALVWTRQRDKMRRRETQVRDHDAVGRPRPAP